MATLIKFPDRSEIEQEAATWLVRLDNDDPLSADERADLIEWLGRSPVHRSELRSLNKFWANDDLTALMVASVKYEHTEDAQPGAGQNSGRLKHWYAYPIAAMLLVFLAYTATLIRPLSAPDDTDLLYATAAGETEVATLPDGSVIHLNTDTELVVNYSASERGIRLLRGEAHFDVTKDTARPFRVFATSRVVQAVGTVFLVYQSDESLDVLVIEGRVALAPLDHLAFLNVGAQLSNTDTVGDGFADSVNGSSGTDNRLRTDLVPDDDDIAILDAGQNITLRATGDPNLTVELQRQEVRSLHAAEILRRQAWRNGTLTFSGDRLDEVVKEISRYTTTRIEIVDPRILEVQVGGRMAIGDVDTLLNALETNFGIEVVRVSENHLLLTAAGEQPVAPPN